MKDNWILSETDPSAINNLLDIFKINHTTASIIQSRGFRTPAEIDLYLNPRLSRMHSPFAIDGMHDAVSRIRSAVKDEQRIGIFSDSDLDGLSSLTLIHQLLVRFGIEPYCRYTKEKETYGLSNDIIDEFNKREIDLLITVDSGIRDVNEISYAKELGIDVIVTDHHEQDEVLPDSIIINPKQLHCKYPFKYLAGVGVVFKLCHALLISYLPSYNTFFILLTLDGDSVIISEIKNGINENILEIEMPDLVDHLELNYLKDHESLNIIIFDAYDLEKMLRNLNRVNIKIYNMKEFLNPLNISSNPGDYTIENISKILGINNKVYNKIEILNAAFFEVQLRSSTRVYEFINNVLEFVAIGSIADVMPLVDENRILVYHGLKSLAKTKHKGLMQITRNLKVNSKAVGWDIAPLLNTPGRFGMTNLAADFFLENSPGKLEEVISNIKDLNEERKVTVLNLYNKIFEKHKNKSIMLDDNIIFEMSDDIPDGLAGLLANRLSDKLNKPVIVASILDTGGDMVKGSGRCRGDFDFFSYVKGFVDEFDRIGGHAQAFGFTAEIGKIHNIISMINSEVGSNYSLESVINIDAEIDISLVNRRFIEELSVMEPYGKDNEAPVFLSRNVTINEFKRIGKEKNHGRYKLNSGGPLTAIGWNLADEMEKYYNSKSTIDLVYNLELNVFNNFTSPQLKIIDLNN